MNNFLFSKMKINFSPKVLLISLSFIFALNFGIVEIFAQENKPTVQTPPADLPKVTQIDNVGLQNLIKREGENQKPLMINLWATWCGPCVEEFPDLVEIDEAYRGKIDFITISMDDVEDINTTVPSFLAKMKAKMPTYLLKSDDEEAAINMITKDWQGALPLTVVYDGKGKIFYLKQGKIKPVDVKKELDKLTAN